ncbi:beta-lactamase family protein [Nostoc ellipsosporum NOK]|nr:beta-lactamase family protein [Nostoc ellipsosporum NOK]
MQKTHSLLTLLLTALAVLTINACQPEDQAPEPVDPTTLNYSPVDKILNDSMSSVFDGRCYAVIHVDGQEVYAKGWGGYDGNTRTLIASCTKWLSGAVLMSLVDQGALKLEDTVGKYLPIFTTYGKGKITLSQLFSHTSGFPGNSTQGYESDASLTLAKAVDSIAKNVPLINAPGTKFNYGGVSMQVAGRICEVASGKSWNTLIQEKIYSPCGMTNTDFGTTNNPIIAGGARSTPNDYIRFLDMLMRKGLTSTGTRVLSEASVTAMEKSYTTGVTIQNTPYPVSYFTTGGIYGIGNWRDLTTSADVLIENSSPGAFGSHPWVNRGKKITGFIFTLLPAGSGFVTAPTCLKVRQAMRDIVP